MVIGITVTNACPTYVIEDSSNNEQYKTHNSYAMNDGIPGIGDR